MQQTGGISGTFTNMHAYTLKEPYGVVGLIFPWNGPVFNACSKLAPALAAGSSCVVKPAEETPLSALLLTRLLTVAGVPDGVANLVTGYGHTVGAAITAHPGIEKVAFTGSTEVGKQIVVDGVANIANSVRSSRSCPSRTTTKLWPWQTIPTTVWRPRRGPATSRGRIASPSAWPQAPSR